jgi:hypothetical protein
MSRAATRIWPRCATNRCKRSPRAPTGPIEINVNAHDPDATKILEMNSFSASSCIADYTRLALWQQLLGLGITPEQCVDMGLSFKTAALLAWH